MKLSDAIMTGITAFKLDPNKWSCEDGGCLMGVAGHAAGIKLGNPENWETDGFGVPLAFVEKWPWAGRFYPVPDWIRGLDRYSAFYDFVRTTKEATAISIISLLAWHVRHGTVSIERVVDWVRSVEPQESNITENEVVLGEINSEVEVEAQAR